MSDLRIGEILHGVKAADWNCCRVEHVAHDWAVARTRGGTPIFVPDYDRNEVGETWHEHGLPCAFADGDN